MAWLKKLDKTKTKSGQPSVWEVLSLRISFGRSIIFDPPRREFLKKK